MPLPYYLKPYDQVALCCPGSICLSKNHPQLVTDYLLENYQLHAIFGPETTQSFSPKKRAEIFLDYLYSDNLKLITALRGGEGTSDILPFLHEHYAEIKKLPPKLLIGFSDFTALLVYFEKYYQWPCLIHGSSFLQMMPQRLLVDEITIKATVDLLFGRIHQEAAHDLQPLNSAAKQDCLIEAELTGGCLSVVDISIKDIWEIETNNKIIFFEDVGEKAHKIIRFLKYFERIGLFKNIKAVILGNFTCDPIGCTQEERDVNEKAIFKILQNFADHHDFPVLYTNQVGHGRTNLPLVYCMPYRLQLGEQAFLKIL